MLFSRVKVGCEERVVRVVSIFLFRFSCRGDTVFVSVCFLSHQALFRSREGTTYDVPVQLEFNS
jgi:hypothetical protein